ncbi:MAG: HAMP domain-containing histidine kinase [Saccharofermentans sp.]|nr:HAMP domain-containing histidine kinase [Saccharofermentans sp.]
MRKKAVNKPVFREIFLIRFLFWIVLLSFAAAYVYSQLYSIVSSSGTHNYTDAYRKQIEDDLEALAQAEPGSEEYSACLNMLKWSLAIYQSVGYNYAEIETGDLRLATDEDTALFIEPVYFITGNEHIHIYFIEDISYLDPLNEFLRNNGMRDERQAVDHWYRYERDPLINDYDFEPYKMETLISAYVNREEHTFLPGIIRVERNGKTYDIDCTPADTKGYEYVEYDPGDEMITMCYRIGTDLSAGDIYTGKFKVGEYLLNDENYYDIKALGKELNVSWRVGYSDYKEQNVFVAAPFSSVLILAIYLVAAALPALVSSVIKYQKAKTIWEIFEYRVKTTEAMAHDLKTPLSTIMFYLENLEESSTDPEKVLECSKNINDKVVAMDHMIGDILLLSRSESGKIELTKEEISLKELVTECLKEFPDMASEITGDDIHLMTNKKVFGQVITNLLSNCDRYKEAGSVVDIAITPGVLTLTNKTDRTYDDVDSLKKPFVKGDDSRGNKGTGLGLAVADNNLAILGYKLELSSESGEFRARVKFK